MKTGEVTHAPHHTLSGKTCFFTHSADSERSWTLSALQTLVFHVGALANWTQLCTKYISANCCCNSPPALCSKTDGSNECCLLPSVKDPGGHTFCHTPWILATSDLLAVDLNHHVAADHCQRHLFLELKRKTSFISPLQTKMFSCLSGRTLNLWPYWVSEVTG